MKMCNRCGINDTKAIKIRFREIMSMRSVCLCVCVVYVLKNGLLAAQVNAYGRDKGNR